MDDFKLRKNFGPLSVEKVREHTNMYKNGKIIKQPNKVNNPLETRAKIDNMNNLRKREWK